MKKLLVLLVVLACCQIAHAEGLTTWLFGGAGDAENNEVFARIGYEKGPIELGAESCWWPNYDPPQVWGVYGLWKFPDAVSFPNPLPLNWLPETFTATPYVGGQISVEIEDRSSMVGPVAGVILQDIITVEYQYRNYGQLLGEFLEDEHRVMFGLRYAF